eukprot:933600-Alexandrium_andersonii.AAC.1
MRDARSACTDAKHPRAVCKCLRWRPKSRAQTPRAALLRSARCTGTLSTPLQHVYPTRAR